MKAVWYEQLGPAEQVLQFGDVETSEPQAGEVLVRIEASGVNPVDTKRRLGGRGDMPFPRIIPHIDGAGVIEKVGQDVDSARIGQRVWLYEASRRPTFWHRRSVHLDTFPKSYSFTRGH